MTKKLFKKSLSLLVCMLLLIGMVPPVNAQENSIKVQLNGENISFDVAPQMVNNRVMVPMRTIYEQLGATVEWNDQTQEITANSDGVVTKLRVNSLDASVTKKEKENKLQLDSAPIIVNGRTLVPVRFISESLGKQVGWDSENKTVVIIDYNYFLNELKTQAPNFYEFITNHYEPINTGEIKQTLDGTYNFKPSANSPANTFDNISTTFKTSCDTKLNPDNGSMDANINITGLAEILKGTGLEAYSDINFNVLFDDNSIYVKSNLFELLERENIKVGDKWIKADIADLGIPDVKTLQDLKKQQANQSISDSFAPLPMDGLTVDSFKQTKEVFNAVVPLVDNEHFTVTPNGDLKVYKWNITKQDLVDVMLDLEKSSGFTEDMTLEDLAQMKKFVDSMVFDFNMEVGVKNNIIVSNKLDLAVKMDIPDSGHAELTLKTNNQIINPNNSSFNIKMPDPKDVIDFEDLQPSDPVASIS